MRRRLEQWTRHWSPIQRTGALLIELSVLIALIGYLNGIGTIDLGRVFGPLIAQFYANVSTELASIAITVLIIDRLYERRYQDQLKNRLIREMASRDNGLALRAVKELQAHGWLADGSLMQADLQHADLRQASLQNANLVGAWLNWADLRGARLYLADLRVASFIYANLEGANFSILSYDGERWQHESANLQEADLRGANLRGAVLSGCNLRGAVIENTDIRHAHFTNADLTDARGLTNEQLALAFSLEGAILPSGKLYDGRFILEGDLHRASVQGVDNNDHKAMAAYYGVSLQDYLSGQEWARANLQGLREEAERFAKEWGPPDRHDQTSH